MRSIVRAALLAGVALTAAAPGAPSASAAPSAPLAAQIEELRPGSAILQYDRSAVTRAGLAARLARLGLAGTAYERLPLVVVRGTRAQLVRAARSEGIVAAHMDERIAFDLWQSRPLVFEGAGETAGDPRAGSGVNVAVVDSGVDGLHPDLRERVVRNVKVLDPLRGSGIGAPAFVECSGPCSTDTTGGHGTHVAGIAVGDGTASSGFYTGVAPGAGVVALGVGEGVTISYALAAFDYLLARPELGVVAVNNSWGRSQSDGRGRYDSTHPVNVATKALHASGVSPVFSAGNTGTGDRTDEPGASRCDTIVDSSGRRVAGPGVCRFSVYGSAPWAIAVAAGRKDRAGHGPGEQYLGYFSSRGDPNPEVSLDGVPVSYLPTLTAPGVNVRAARQPASVTAAAACGSAEPPACTDVPRPEYEARYVPVSGTSMAAPHVTGAIAAIQSVASRRLGRLLTPDEVRTVLVDSAAPMTEQDAFWDWPCGTSEIFVDCGVNGQTSSAWSDTSGTPYEPYQVGAGYLNVAAAIRAVEAMGSTTTTTAPASGPGQSGTKPCRRAAAGRACR
jgi:serine protease AprX